MTSPGSTNLAATNLVSTHLAPTRPARASCSPGIEAAQRELTHSLEHYAAESDREGYATAPLPVLLVQQRDESSQAPDNNRNPCRRHRRHEFGLAHVLRDFRQNEQKEAGGDAAQDHLLHAAHPEEAQTNRSRKHDHGGEQERPRQQQLILQPIAHRAETGAISTVAQARRLPK